MFITDQPQQAKWRAYFGGNPGNDLRGTFFFTCAEGRQPNRFHRLVQYWVLGIYWVKRG